MALRCVLRRCLSTGAAMNRLATKTISNNLFQQQQLAPVTDNNRSIKHDDDLQVAVKNFISQEDPKEHDLMALVDVYRQAKRTQFTRSKPRQLNMNSFVVSAKKLVVQWTLEPKNIELLSVASLLNLSYLFREFYWMRETDALNVISQRAKDLLQKESDRHRVYLYIKRFLYNFSHLKHSDEPFVVFCEKRLISSCGQLLKEESVDNIVLLMSSFNSLGYENNRIYYELQKNIKEKFEEFACRPHLVAKCLWSLASRRVDWLFWEQFDEHFGTHGFNKFSSKELALVCWAISWKLGNERRLAYRCKPKIAISVQTFLETNAATCDPKDLAFIAQYAGTPDVFPKHRENVICTQMLKILHERQSELSRRDFEVAMRFLKKNPPKELLEGKTENFAALLGKKYIS